MIEEKQLETEIVTTIQAVELLEVSKQTIYNYVKIGKLPLVYEDWQIDGTMKFFRKDIDRLKQITERPEGLTVLEVANKIGVSKATIHQYIKSGKLNSVKIKLKGRDTLFLSLEDVNKLQENIQNHSTKKSYFTKDLKYYLFGLFVKPNTNEKARIIELTEDGALIAKTNMGELLNKEDLMNRGFERAYELKKSKHSTKRGTIVFYFPIPQTLNAPVFEIIDNFYINIGVQNMNLTIKNGIVKVELKPVKLPYSTDRLEQDFEILQNCLQKGKLSSRPGFIVMSSHQEQLTTFVEESIKNKIKRIANEHHTGLEDITEKLIRLGLAEYERNKRL